MKLFTFVLLLGLTSCWQRGPRIGVDQLTALCVEKKLTCKLSDDHQRFKPWSALAHTNPTDKTNVDYWSVVADTRVEAINDLGHLLSGPPNYPASKDEILNDPRK